ncbi:MAG: division/cell wall cluster transcriptional repressor MraZ [Proteobacteria bacterium]|nr:division/cell wall cluster transcriptional repressor MraZ [Pseudomonadota bacterium]
MWDKVVFYGEVALNLDAKGRLAIPSMYREPIASACDNALVLTYNAYENDSLWLYPQAEWEQVRDSVMALSTFDPMHRALQRRLVGSAYHLNPDKGSRILLPVTLRQVASMEKRVVMLGLGKKFEIWNEDALNKQRHEVPAMGGEVSDDMKSLVL